MRACVRACVRVCVRACVSVSACVCVRVCVGACMRVGEKVRLIRIPSTISDQCICVRTNCTTKLNFNISGGTIILLPYNERKIF